VKKAQKEDSKKAHPPDQGDDTRLETTSPQEAHPISSPSGQRPPSEGDLTLKDEEWFEIQNLRKQGLSISEIARKMKRTRRTIRKYIDSEVPVKYGPRKIGPSILDPFMEFIEGEVASASRDGRRANGKVIFKKIRIQGYEGSRALSIPFP
jgi:hypothetical protein